jgi:hypothetical protein
LKKKYCGIKKLKTLKQATKARYRALKGKSPAGCGLPDSYKGWVSKHNPYTILKRKFTIKKF